MADVVSLQVVQCIDGDMLSAESVGAMPTWTFSGNIPLLSTAEVFEVCALRIEVFEVCALRMFKEARRKRVSFHGGTAKIKKTAAHP